MYMSEFRKSITKSLEIQSNVYNFHCVLYRVPRGEGLLVGKNDSCV